MANDQTAKRAAQDAAFEAWRGRPRDADREEIDRLWLAMWEAADFCWDGLADAGWELGDEASEAQKLKRWRAPADFPGDGEVHGEGETAWKAATLQDYWRWSIGIEDGGPRLLDDDALIAADLLVRDEDGVLWHVLHRPEMTANTGAEDSEDPRAKALTAAMLARLYAASGYSGYNAPDGRVLMTGALAQGLDAVWRSFGGADDLDPRNLLHVAAGLARFERLNASGLAFGDGMSFDQAMFSRRISFRRATLGDGASFREADFGGGRMFGEVTFGDRASFRNATFGNDSSFRAAAFGDNAVFSGTMFGDHARMRRATFGKHASFREATFGDRAVFAEAKFGDHASFRDAKFGDSAVFRETTFSDRAWFSGVKFGYDTAFRKAIFRDRAWFSRARFGGRASFRETTFGDRAVFAEAKFGDHVSFRDAKFGDSAVFRRTTFGDRAWFSGVKFGDDAVFGDAGFGDRTMFGGACFSGRVTFCRHRKDTVWTFAAAVSFKSARFEGPALFGDNSARPGASFGGRISFRAAVFEDYADFSRCVWPERAQDQHAAFEGARFRSIVDFNAPRFTAFALFDGADFERRIRFSDPHAPETPDKVFEAAMVETAAAVRRDESAEERQPNGETAGERGAEQRWATLAGGFRTLKRAMQAQSDHDREQRFYRYELKARMRQPSVKLWVRIAAELYGVSSDYGTSIIRPFISLAVLIAVFAALYWGAAQIAGAASMERGSLAAPNSADIAPALDLSLSSTFRPFGVWWGPSMPVIPPQAQSQPVCETAQLASEAGLRACRDARLAAASWTTQLAHALGPLGWTGVKALATVQSFFSIVLLFLFALAVRRRFQIS